MKNKTKPGWTCAYDGTKDKLSDGRCSACGRASSAESKRDAKKWDDAANPTHTPGPWKVPNDETSRKHSVDVSIYSETPKHKNPKYICRVYGEGVLSNSVEERDANARLIATAPELLEACKALIGPTKNVPWMRAVEMARHAIAKAEGRS